MSIVENRQTGNRNRELHAVTEVAKTLTMHLDLHKLLEAVMNKIDDVLDPAEFGVILLWDPTQATFRPQASCGAGLKDPNALYEIEMHENESITGEVFQANQARLWSNKVDVARTQASLQKRNQDMMLQAFGSIRPKSIVGAPLSAFENKYGVLILGTLSGNVVFENEDVPFVQTLADLIALAIDRSRFEDKAAAIEATKQAERIRAESMATLSHEIRTPLAAIKGYSTALLLDEVEWPREKQREFLSLIDEECDNLQTMISDILDSSLIDVGQLSFASEPVRIEYLSREVALEMQRRTIDHKLVVDFPSDFPIVEVDTYRIKQVIRNILDNSIKYSPEGGLIVIRGEVRPSDVVISIADQGVGISPEDLIPLFEKYFRVKDATGYHVPGTGLGLPVARAIVEIHGGRIWANSKVGEGTTLYFSIPLPEPKVEFE
jgi:K+-sensing histidine kinase KdpD